MNLFKSDSVAKGYSKDRIYLHPEIIHKVKARLVLDQKVNRALDVGCGAGLSTLALKDIAKSIVGVDSSEAMINSAIKDKDIKYYNYPAEHLPFDSKFDIITLAGSINWVNRSKFFSEAKRIITKDGMVIVYDIYILGTMEGNDTFGKWFQEEYLREFPKPPRDESPLTKAEALTYGFSLEDVEDYVSKGQFSLDSFKRYLHTQSNITTAVNTNSWTREQIEEWLNSSLVHYFDGNQNVLFGGYIWYLKNHQD